MGPEVHLKTIRLEKEVYIVYRHRMGVKTPVKSFLYPIQESFRDCVFRFERKCRVAVNINTETTSLKVPVSS